MCYRPGRFLLRGLMLLLLILGCSSCLPSDTRVWKEPGFQAPEMPSTLYIVPFSSILAPEEVRDRIFDGFVDELAEKASELDTQVVILKKELQQLDAWWLSKQTYVTGEIFAYVEESGCCSTSIRLRGRIELFAPQDETASVRVEFPRETFFDHDYSNLSDERDRLTKNLAEEMAEALLKNLKSR